MTHLPVGCASAHIVYEEFYLKFGVEALRTQPDLLGSPGC